MINMKAIELTEKHKSKLLEMCNKLFLEFKEYNQQEDYSNNWLENKIWFKINKKFIGIHWFEFCMTHLTEKLGTNYEVSYYEMMHNYHPVDYLYKEFKKLK